MGTFLDVYNGVCVRFRIFFLCATCRAHYRPEAWGRWEGAVGAFRFSSLVFSRLRSFFHCSFKVMVRQEDCDDCSIFNVSSQ